MAEEKNFFADSEAYERSMGRLSRVAGEAFLDWLSLPSGLRCLDVGCGTGSFTELWLDRNAPSAMYAIDPSEGQIALAKGKPWASRVDLRVGDAMSLPFGDDEFDVAVMALVIQYIPDRTQAMSEITRVVRQGGTVAAYVWPAPGEGPPTQPLQDAVKSIGVSRGRRPRKKSVRLKASQNYSRHQVLKQSRVDRSKASSFSRTSMIIGPHRLGRPSGTYPTQMSNGSKPFCETAFRQTRMAKSRIRRERTLLEDGCQSDAP
jgi:ubiquinone/menaquinone biosynthesis C-methylase UbiE